ncbi:MAG: NifB/NifX family molybdenum-iron cluster-binding protein [Candidatus Bathyarchaeia archaeon]
MAKTLANINVNFVLAAEIGPGASELLNYHGIKVIMVKPGIGVAEAIRGNMLKFE